jgi:hypothetical protein
MFPPNTELTMSMITNRALIVLRNDLTFSRTVNHQYDKSFGVDGAKIGATINLRKPVRYIGNPGPTMVPESFTETFVPLTLTSQYNVGLNFTTSELMLSIDEFDDRVLKPAVATLANKIDFDGLALALQVANFVGIPGQTPSAALTFMQAKTALDNNAAPVDDNRSVTINSLTESYMVDALKGLYNRSGEIGEQNVKGRMATGFGWDKWYMDQNVYTQTIGALGGTPVVSAGGQTGSQIAISGCSDNIAGWLNQGDIVSFAGVQGVNPQNRQPWGTLQPFVLTAPVTTSNTGTATLNIYPAIVLTGAYQTVNASPINGAAVYVYGLLTTSNPAQSAIAGITSPQNLGYHKDAFTVACVDLPVPRNVELGARAADEDVGFSVRILRNYDIYQDGLPTRLDVLYGWCAMRPELAVRIVG